VLPDLADRRVLALDLGLTVLQALLQTGDVIRGSPDRSLALIHSNADCRQL
jgi:hypothetical protein